MHTNCILNFISLSVTGNMDRHHYELFDFEDDWKNDTYPVILDNGRG